MSEFLKFDTRFRRANSPPCITARRVAASLIKWCEATEKDAAVVVFLRDHFIRKTTPASRSAEASRRFLDRSATPPCGDARRGVRSSAISGSLCFPQAVWNPCRDQDL